MSIAPQRSPEPAALTLYGSFRSRARRVLWAILETGAPFEHRPYGARDAALKADDYLAINPTGRIPALRDGDLALSESLSINLYVAKTYGGALYPPEHEPKLLQWSLFAASDLDPWLTLYVGHAVNLPEAERDPAIAALGRERLGRSLSFLEAALAQNEVLVGNHFTIADLNVASVLQPLLLNDLDISGFPVTAAWLARQIARPAAQAARDYP